MTQFQIESIHPSTPYLFWPVLSNCLSWLMTHSMVEGHNCMSFWIIRYINQSCCVLGTALTILLCFDDKGDNTTKPFIHDTVCFDAKDTWTRKWPFLTVCYDNLQHPQKVPVENSNLTKQAHSHWHGSLTTGNTHFLTLFFPAPSAKKPSSKSHRKGGNYINFSSDLNLTSIFINSPFTQQSFLTVSMFSCEATKLAPKISKISSA